MNVLGIESSCDECSVAIVKDGKKVLSHIIASQVDIHSVYDGVVPEIASRKHVEWIQPVYRKAMAGAGLEIDDIDGIAVTNRPGLSGSLAVGLSFAKGLALASSLPFITIDHILAHLYAPQLENDISYPFMGLLVSGGHSMICLVKAPDDLLVMGASIDDAIGEAFDKVAKHYGLGYPGGKVVDQLARNGNPKAFHFPFSQLNKGDHRFDVSYSGLKNAVVNQLDLFWDGSSERSIENICASFERVAVDSLLKKLTKAIEETGIKTVVAGGGVAANTYLRKKLAMHEDYKVYYPSLELCTDNGAMIAGLGHYYLEQGLNSQFDEGVKARVPGFKKYI